MDEVDVNEDSAIKQNLLNETIVASAVESNQSLGNLFCDGTDIHGGTGSTSEKPIPLPESSLLRSSDGPICQRWAHSEHQGRGGSANVNESFEDGKTKCQSTYSPEKAAAIPKSSLLKNDTVNINRVKSTKPKQPVVRKSSKSNKDNITKNTNTLRAQDEFPPLSSRAVSSCWGRPKSGQNSFYKRMVLYRGGGQANMNADIPSQVNISLQNVTGLKVGRVQPCRLILVIL